MEKQQRTPVPLSREQRDTINKAANYFGISMAAFMRQAALEKARYHIQVLRQAEIAEISPDNTGEQG